MNVKGMRALGRRCLRQREDIVFAPATIIALLDERDVLLDALKMARGCVPCPSEVHAAVVDAITRAESQKP